MNVIEKEMVEVLKKRLKILNKVCGVLTSQINDVESVYGNKNVNVKVCTGRGKPSWYKKTRDEDRYTFSKDIDLIAPIVQFKYNKKSLPYIREEIKYINKLLHNICTDKIDSLYNSTHPARRALIQPVKFEITDEELISNFMKRPQCTLGFEPGAPIHRTRKGLRVRSKSEESIAECLDEYKIPYLYEPEIVINGRTFHPDFVCLNVRTRTIYIWEHLGSMGNSNYADNNAVPKFWGYVQAGYKLGQDLLITLESELNPFHMQQAELIIKQYLI